MKKRFLALCIFLFILAACQQAQTPHPTATRYQVSDTPTASTIPPTATHRPQVSATPSPAPLQLDLPAIPEKMPAHKLALDEFNTGAGMKHLATYEMGQWSDLVFSPDGKYIVAAIGRGISFYDSKTFVQTSFIDVDGPVGVLAFSPADPVIAVAVRGKVSLWNILSGQKMTEMEGKFDQVLTLAYSSTGYVAATGYYCSACDTFVQKMTIWDAKTGQPIYFEKDILYETHGLAFTKDGKRLAYGAREGLSLWDVETKQKIIIPGTSTQPTAKNEPFMFIFNQDETSLFVTSESDTDQTIEITSGKMGPFDLCDTNLMRSQTIGGCLKDKQIVLFDLSTGETLSEIDGVDNLGHLITLSPDGEMVAFQAENLFYVVNAKTDKEINKVVFNQSKNIQTDIVLFNGQRIYVVAIRNERGSIDLINLESGAHLQTYTLPNATIVHFAFRPDQKTVATLDDTKTITLWDIQTQHILYQTVLSEYVLPPFVFSPNGSALFFTTPNNTVLTLQQFSGKLLSLGENHYFFGAADPYIHSKYFFNQDGHLILFYPTENNVQMIDTFTEQSQSIPFESVNEKRYLEVEAYALNRNDKLVAFGTTKNIFVWNTETLQQLSMLAGHNGVGGDGFYGMIESVLFSPQSDLLVSVGWDGTTRLWNVHAGQELRRLNVCCQAVFTPDGRYLVTAGSGVLRVWGIPALTP